MIVITDLKEFAKDYHDGQVAPRRKELAKFISARMQQIKKVTSNRFAELEDLNKANKEHDFLNAISELDKAQSIFMDKIHTHIHKCLSQYAFYINQGASIKIENEFLKERLNSLEKREDEWIKILRDEFRKTDR